MSWEIVVGIETHTQLLTKSKIFSGASTEFGAAPNTQASAVDIALARHAAGAANHAAIQHAIRFGLAVNGKISPALHFRAQELLLSGSAEGLPDQPVRIPVVHRAAR
jgi:aspartyl-tRNA(Asn)/glutamyl-tRNA(Gln) amidotransferase subunit B